MIAIDVRDSPWTLRAEIRLMAVFIVRSGRNLLPATSQPSTAGVLWYRPRVWIELGCRALKGTGWEWQKTRRADPDRVARHWLVLAVATLWVLAAGTRAEDTAARGIPPTT